MKLKFTLFLACACLSLLVTTNSASAQSVGDYQTNGTGGGDWTTIATWQTWNGSAWVAAAAFPTSTDGVITILGTDSVALQATITIDQVVVATGGKLAMGGGNTITLANTPPNAIDNSGRLYADQWDRFRNRQHPQSPQRAAESREQWYPGRPDDQ
ncbi:hypothetical protein ACQ86N_05650 [Puia sp. P3]|uniref:hypothetical protein n=1 Tax=Puia sp. P3 TaxID=3423952 RepID=UPI003D665652